MKMFKQALTVACALSLVTGAAALAGDIYKWVDADGNVHYEDRPINREAERVAIESRPTDRAAVAAHVQSAAEARAKAREARAAEEANAPTPEELRAAAEEKARKCSDYRQRLQKMLTSRRLYREDENGERVYLDEAQMQSARDRVQSQVEEYCGA
jgi:hypothetical protein